MDNTVPSVILFIGISLPLEVAKEIIRYLFTSITAQLILPSVLWQRLQGRPSRQTELLRAFYDLRAINSYWKYLINSTPHVWTYFLLSRLDGDSFDLQLKRASTAESSRFTVLVEDSRSLSYFVDMIVEGHRSRMEVIYMNLQRDQWFIGRRIMDRFSFAHVHSIFFAVGGRPGGRDVVDYGAGGAARVAWSDDVDTGVINAWPNSADPWPSADEDEIFDYAFHGANWHVNDVDWNAHAELRTQHPQTRHTDDLPTEDFSKFTSLSTLCLSRKDFISRTITLPESITCLHVRPPAPSNNVISIHIMDFASLLQSVPRLTEFEGSRFGMDVRGQPLPIQHDNLRRLSISCSSSAIHPLMSVVQQCPLETVVVEVFLEGVFHGAAFNEQVRSVAHIFSQKHNITSVGVSVCHYNKVSSTVRVDASLASPTGAVMTFRLPRTLRHAVPVILSSPLQHSCRLVFDPSLRPEHFHMNTEIVSDCVPWSHFLCIHVVYRANLFQIILTAIRSSFPPGANPDVVLHGEALGGVLEELSGGNGGQDIIRFRAAVYNRCCRLDSGQPRLRRWSALDGSHAFSGLVQGLPEHLVRMLAYYD